MRPNPADMRPECSRPRLRTARRMSRLKNEEDRCGAPGHCDAGYDTALRCISRGSGMEGAPYGTATGTATGGTGTTTGSTTTGPAITPRRFSRPSSFLLRCNAGGVLFPELSAPSAEHSADLVQRRGKRDIFFVVERSCLPEDHEQYFERVEFARCKAYVRPFF